MPHRPVVTGVERRSPPRERPSMHLTLLSLADLGLRSDARARSMRTNTSKILVLSSQSTDHHARGALRTFVKLENQRAMSVTSARHASRQHGGLQHSSRASTNATTAFSTQRRKAVTEVHVSPPDQFKKGHTCRCSPLELKYGELSARAEKELRMPCR